MQTWDYRLTAITLTLLFSLYPNLIFGGGARQMHATGGDVVREQSILLTLVDGHTNSKIIEIRNTPQAQISINADFGVWQDDFVLQLNEEGMPAGDIKIEERIETSLTINDEGPHMDLTEWKHHYTKWKKLKRINDSNHWESGQFNSRELEKFPAFTVDEVKAHLRKQKIYDMDRWLKLTDACAPFQDHPCLILPSRVFLKISFKKGNRWVDYKNIEILLPMGC